MAAAILLAVGAASAQDPQRGKLLYENNCLSCHYESIHKREPSKSLIRSLARLRVEVANRAAMTKQRLSVEDVDDIAEYLNRSHYKLQE